MKNNLNGKKVLLVGSGADLNGRALAERIDSGEEWPVVARVNKHYGAREDVGCRMDLCFVARRVWYNWWFAVTCPSVPAIVAFAEGVGCPKEYRAAVAAELGLPRVSTGLAAVHLLLAAGASVDIIGFNAPGGVPLDGGKIYADGTDGNIDRYDWTAELAWLQAQPRVTLL